MSVPFKCSPSILRSVALVTGEPEEGKLIGADRPHDVGALPADPTALGLAKSVFSPMKVYRFRLVRSATLVSNGAGGMTLSTQIYPTNMLDGSTLALLFSEARLMQARLHIVPLAPLGGPGPLAITFDPAVSSVATGPASYSDLIRRPGTKLINTWNTLSSVTMTYKCTNRPWSLAGVTATSGDPAGGLTGAFCYSLGAAVTGAVNVASYIIEVDYEFRNRI